MRKAIGHEEEREANKDIDIMRIQGTQESGHRTSNMEQEREK
jgi:hypothetical protein